MSLPFFFINFPYLTTEDFILLSAAAITFEIEHRTITYWEVLPEVDHLPSQVVLNQINRFLRVHFECQVSNIDNSATHTIIPILMSVIANRHENIVLCSL